MERQIHVVGLLACLFLFAPSESLRAQCPPQWSDRFGVGSFPDSEGHIACFEVFDADASGPARPALYAGGVFQSFGRNIAKWDGTSWSSLGAEMTGTDRFVTAMTVCDIDGSGPGLPALYACGHFTGFGGVNANNIARWDGSSWSPLGSGVDITAYAMAEFDEDGPGPIPPALYLGGQFANAGGTPASKIAKWDGASWSSVGTGMDLLVYALTVFDDDGSGPNLPALYAAGWFSTAGGVSADHIAKWDGASWSPLGTGIDGSVYALGVFDEDDAGPIPPALYAGGDFTTAGGVSARSVAKWDGSSWSSVGPVGIEAPQLPIVYSLTPFDEDGNGPNPPALFASGQFYDSSGNSGQNRIARWDGTSWSSVEAGVNNSVFDTAVFDADDAGPEPAALFAGGLFTRIMDPFIEANRVARWNGTSWSRLDNGLGGFCYGMAVFDDDGSGSGPPLLYVGGAITSAGSLDPGPLVRWDGSAWSQVPGVGEGMGAVATLAALDEDGTGPLGVALYVGGYFRTALGVNANYIARWDGAAWSNLGTGVGPGNPNLNTHVNALAVFDTDNVGPNPATLFVGGEFTTAGPNGGSASRIAMWDSSSWAPVGSGFNGEVHALTVFDDDGLAGPHPRALYAAGNFTFSGSISLNRIAKWNGVSWSSLGGMNGRVRALTVFDDDGSGPHLPALIAGGDFTTAGGVAANHVAKWNGTAWSALGSGTSDSVFSLTTFDRDGSGPTPPALHVGGFFSTAGGVSAHQIARWNGSSWAALGSGIENSNIFSAATVMAMQAFDEDGSGPDPASLYACGYFDIAGGMYSSNIARWSACEFSVESFCFGDGTAGSCPCANVGASGRGCNNSASTGGAVLTFTGSPSLSADTLSFTSTGELPSSLSIFLQGNTEVAPITYGDGLRCVGGSLKRLFVKNAVGGGVSAPGAGDPSVSARSALAGDTIVAGSLRHYQTYYRDGNPSFCPAPPGNTWNVSNGLSAAWGP